VSDLRIGVDLAWGVGERPNETGVCALAADGRIVAAGWTRGVGETVDWILDVAGEHATLFVDAPLLVENPAGQRLCETEVGRRYGRNKVSANPTNLGSTHQAGARLREALQAHGWRYDDGLAGPHRRGRRMYECYPYTTLVGVSEFGYDVRPPYKRRPVNVPLVDWRGQRAATFDGMVERLSALAHANPPIDITSHPTTATLLEPSPLVDRPYKHREDLLDACIAAWTASLWITHGLSRIQPLGALDRASGDAPLATIMAPYRAGQESPWIIARQANSSEGIDS